jgi:PHP family Zn ribbon phosphoesterase
MSPRTVVDQGLARQLDVIAVCDHNSAENVAPAVRLGRRKGLCVLPGMEVCSREEVHMLAIFSEIEQALSMQEFVYEHLRGENRPEVFGYQVVANEADEVLAENQRLLIGASELNVHAIADQTHAIGGLSIAAHVDRPSYSLIGQLGFIPPDLALDAVEISWRLDLAEARAKIPGLEALPLITSSDAHFVEDIGRGFTRMRLAEPNFEEIRLALRGARGRHVEV